MSKNILCTILDTWQNSYMQGQKETQDFLLFFLKKNLKCK